MACANFNPAFHPRRRAKEKSKANKAKAAPKQEPGASSGAATSPSPPTESPRLGDTAPLDQTETQGEQPQEMMINTHRATPPVITPPQLCVFTNPDASEWDHQRLAGPTNDESLTATHQRSEELSAAELYVTRRGSLPAHAFPHQPISPTPPDPLAALHRRGSVDHITTNYGMFPRVRSDGVTGMRGQRMLASRSPPLSRSSQCYPQGRSGLCPPNAPFMGARRASMDSRAMFLSQRGTMSPSQPPLSGYSGSSRASLPIPNSLYTIPSRTISPPGPGPLPSPNFQFGAASSAGLSSSPGESERNSPESPNSLIYKDEERDDDNTSVGSYVPQSRFGSFQSVATSESGSIYSDFTNITSGMPSPAIMSGRRHSWYVFFKPTTGLYLHLP